MNLPGNMQARMRQAEQMQKKLQEEIALIRVEATAGGGMVTVKMDGKKNVTFVKIDPEVAGRGGNLPDKKNVGVPQCGPERARSNTATKQRTAAPGGLSPPPT